MRLQKATAHHEQEQKSITANLSDTTFQGVLCPPQSWFLVGVLVSHLVHQGVPGLLT